MAKNIGICFSADFVGNEPLSHIHVKRPVYLRLVELIEKNGFNSFVLTKKTYQGNSIFKGAWQFTKGEFRIIKSPVKIDLIYDRVGGIVFPPQDNNMCVVNRKDFKILAWDKWKTYKEIGQYMPKTFWVGEIDGVANVVDNITTKNIVVKPFNGLQGKDIYIGSKENIKNFKPIKKGRKYIIQDFVDTSNGIPGLTSGKHDLRIVVINGEVVWCHIRVPAKGSFLANAAQGGNLTEINYSKVPQKIKKIVSKISTKFYKEFNNPIFSIDFGVNEKGEPKIFEINDQIGFPKWEMKNRDIFLMALVKNFKDKIA